MMRILKLTEIVELPELEEVDLEHFEDDELNEETIASEDSILPRRTFCTNLLKMI